ncbi:hypothetical protein Tco_0066994 [Tanacetum coccineum]
MSSASTVTYTSVYTDSEPGRVFWGDDEELSDKGSPRVIVYGNDGPPIQPVAPSPDYVPGLEHPSSPDYVPGPEHPPSPAEIPYIPDPKYPEYLVPSDDEAPWEDQPLPVDASPVALSAGYVADSDPEEDHVDYPADGGDDDDEPSNDDDDDTDDEETKPFEMDESTTTPPSPSTHRTTARISIRPEAPMPIPSEEEVERHLALPSPPLPLISLSPPSAEERLARCLAAHALPSSPLPIVPRPYGSPNHVRAPLGFRSAMGRLRALSPSTTSITTITTSTIITTFTTIFDRREDSLEAELPPRKRLCLTALISRYKGCLVDPTEAVEEVAPTTLEGVNPRVTEPAAVQEQDTQDIYAGQMSAVLGQIQALQARDQTHADEREGAASTAVGLVFSFLISDNHNNMPPRRSSATARAATAAAAPMTADVVEQLIEARVSTTLANHETL